MLLRVRRTSLPTVRYAFARRTNRVRSVPSTTADIYRNKRYERCFDFDDVSTVLTARKEKSAVEVRFRGANELARTVD